MTPVLLIVISVLVILVVLLCSEMDHLERSAEDDRKSFGVMCVSRMFDNDRAVMISTRRRLTDDQLRELHEWLR